MSNPTVISIGAIFGLIAALWVFTDAKYRKMDNFSSCVWACVVFFFTIPGIIIYLFLRPNDPAHNEFLDGPKESSNTKTIQIPEQRLTQQVNYNRAVDTKNMVNCEYCGQSIHPIAIRCPHCHEDRSEYVDQAFNKS